MKLNVKAFALTIGLVWAVALFLIILANLIWCEYGVALLDVVDSIYPGYHRGTTVGLIVGPLYGFVDAVVAGWIFAWLYNRFCGKSE